MKLDTLHPQARLPARRALRGRVASHEVTTPFPFSGALDDGRGDQSVHRGLFRLNRRRIEPGMVSESTLEFREALRELATIQYFESRILTAGRHATEQHAAEAPRDAAGLLTWLDGLRVSGPGQLDPMWSWLATCASERELHWFVLQEVIAEVATTDLVEVVLGNKATLPLLERLRHTAMLLGVKIPIEAADCSEVTWQSMARANLVTALAATRRSRVNAAGALAAMMMVQPARLALIDCALTRLGYDVYPPTPPVDRESVARLVHQQLLQERDGAAQIATGALMWMRTGVRCLDGYRHRLLHDASAA